VLPCHRIGTAVLLGSIPKISGVTVGLPLLIRVIHGINLAALKKWPIQQLIFLAVGSKHPPILMRPLFMVIVFSE
jgi:hypothetical protein